MLQVVETPVLMKSVISVMPKPLISAPTMGRTTKSVTGIALPFKRKYISSPIMTNPVIASNIGGLLLFFLYLSYCLESASAFRTNAARARLNFSAS